MGSNLILIRDQSESKTLEQLFDEAIQTLQEHEPPEGYFVCFSGGKDSIVIYDLVKRSGVKHDAHFHKTSIDPPELLTFIKTNYPEVIWERPKETMFQIIEKWAMLPTRNIRYCCKILKEAHGYGRICVTGLRKDESAKRANRKMFETDKVKSHNKRYLNIIVDWKTKHVWEYIKTLGLAYPSLYDEGWTRIGCIGCPMANRKQQFMRYPNFKKAYIEAIRRAMKTKPDKHFGTDAEMYVDWWMTDISPKSYLEKQKQTDFLRGDDNGQ